jgi:hypothetical protein
METVHASLELQIQGDESLPSLRRMIWSREQIAIRKKGKENLDAGTIKINNINSLYNTKNYF